MMIDAPSYESKSDDEDVIALTDKNTDNILNYVNNMM